MTWQNRKVTVTLTFRAAADGKIYQFKVNEDGTIEHDCSLSGKLRDASGYLSRYRRWFGHWIPIQNES